MTRISSPQNCHIPPQISGCRFPSGCYVREVVRPTRSFCDRLLLLSAVALVTCASAAPAAVVTEAFIEAVGQIESSGGRFVIGDGGRANGTWQMHAAAWKDVTAFRARQGMPTWSYHYAHEPAVARLYARDYLTILENQLRNTLRRGPSAELVYAAYNIGFTRLESLGFRLERTPRTTQAACARLAPLLREMERTSEKFLVHAKAN